MGSTARKAAPVLIAAYLAYTCWGALPAEKKSFGTMKPPASSITIDMLPLRGAEEPPPVPSRNPFVSEQEREEARRRAEEERLRALQAEQAPEEPPPPAQPPFRPFRLELQSILSSAGSACARISGRSLRPGDALTGLDKEQPPVLARIGDGFVEIRHRDRTYVLDLGEQRSVTVRPEDVDG